MAYSPEEFKGRTKKFALRVLRLVESLPRRRAADHISSSQVGRRPIRNPKSAI